LKKKITVITPTFNSANTILANLASVKNQKYKNLEHIIIDNKSVDGTLNLIKKQNDKRIKIVSEQDNGIYDAINKGIKLAKGEIISILHSDDKYYNNHTLLNIINNFEDRNIDIIYGDLLYTKKII
jgi:glycosyltransferase involved in cell wall biosynthesis